MLLLITLNSLTIRFAYASPEEVRVIINFKIVLKEGRTWYTTVTGGGGIVNNVTGGNVDNKTIWEVQLKMTLWEWNEWKIKILQGLNKWEIKIEGRCW